MGAVRIRETYLRGDQLLVSMKDTLLGEGSVREGKGEPPRNEGWERNQTGGNYCYVCPTADFLQCYLELFDRPDLTACFRHGDSAEMTASAAGVGKFGSEEPGGAVGGSGSGEGREGAAACSLLLLHSELSKLTGATGALSMKQERRLAQVRDDKSVVVSWLPCVR